MLLVACKSTQKCDAYSFAEYEYIEVIGYSDKIPTFGEAEIHLPPGKYLLKAYKGDHITYIRYEKRIQGTAP